MLYCVHGAAEFNTGKALATQLAVRTLDAFTCQFDLNTTAPYFLMLCSSYLTLPLPRDSIQAARARPGEERWVDWSGVGGDPYIANYPDPNDLLTFYAANYRR